MTEQKKYTSEHRLIAKKSLPLYHKRIIVTSPRNYAAVLTGLLIEKGAKLLWMPTIEIGPVDDYTKLDSAISNISKYDWIGFTSRNGIEAFFNRIEIMDISPENIFNEIKTCVIGADAKGLEEKGIKPDLVPQEASPRGIIKDLSRINTKGEKILLPVPEVTGLTEPYVVPDFIKGLEEIGMKTEAVPSYRTSAVTEGHEIEKKIILEGKADLIAFTSSTEIESLLSIVEGNIDIINRIPIAIMGPYTGKTAENNGLKISIMPAKEFSSFRRFVKDIEDYFRTDKE